MEKKYAIGADAGGSHISAIIVDLESGKVLDECFSGNKVNNKGSADEILNEWKSALEKSLSTVNKVQLAGIGIAMPGPFDYTNGIALFTHAVNKYEKLYGINIAFRLGELLNLDKKIPIRFMNDASSFAVGEAWKGKTTAYKKSVAITLGTGFGSAFIESGIPVLERNDVPAMGCLYHLPYIESIANDYFCSNWFVKKYFGKKGITLPGVKEMAELARYDSSVNEIFEEFGSSLGEFIAPWIRKLNAECLVIGGNMVRSFHLFGPSLTVSLKIQNAGIVVELSEMLETSAMVGAARLLDDDFWKTIKPLLSKM